MAQKAFRDEARKPGFLKLYWATIGRCIITLLLLSIIAFDKYTSWVVVLLFFFIFSGQEIQIIARNKNIRNLDGAADKFAQAVIDRVTKGQPVTLNKGL